MALSFVVYGELPWLRVFVKVELKRNKGKSSCKTIKGFYLNKNKNMRQHVIK